jgi:hypothetical protein
MDEQEAVFRLAVKQYTPLDNLNPQPGDLTIIGAHANGFPKVRYPVPLIHAYTNRRRNSTNLYGTNFSSDPSNKGSEYEAYG